MNGAEAKKSTSRAFAMAFRAYTECCAEVQAAIREMTAIVNDPEADEDEREMALATIAEALSPRDHTGHPGIDIGAWDRLDSRQSPADSEALDRQEATFAGRVGAILRERSMTQAELAEAIGIGQPAVSMLLSRRSRPQARTVRKIAAALGVAANDLRPGLKD